MQDSFKDAGNNRIRVLDRLNSPRAYAIRDFLSRSVVEFDWIELTCDADCEKELGLPSLENARLPVVEFPDGSRLNAPSLRELADKLGWVTLPKLKEYDLSIYGAGPAGLSAAVYAASEGLRTVLVERQAVGGQAGTSSLIENYMGFPNGVSGAELAERARQQAVRFGIEILLMREGVKSEFKKDHIYTDMADGSSMTARANLCTTGVEYRRLNLGNEDRFLHRGVYYGAGAGEAPMCINEDVYVVGGGNSAGQAVMHFSRYAKKVVMIVRSKNLATSLSHYLLNRIEESNNVEVLFNSRITALEGDESLREIEITDTLSQAVNRAETSRLFVCIGGAPNTEWAKDTGIIRDAAGYLVTGQDLMRYPDFAKIWKLPRPPFHLETSVPGSFAAGDVRHNSVKRVASAVGEGAMAVTFVHQYLAERS